MRVSHDWLGDFVDLSGVEPARVAELLTLSGTEVERVVPFGQGLSEIVVGEVVALRPIDGSDHLLLAQVRAGGEPPLEVVCGAPNVFVGALVPWARPGCSLPSGSRLAQRRIRGQVSNGMLCAPDELGLGQEHEGVLILSAEDAQSGQPFGALYPPDTVYELEILSNRSDCLSHWGVARELAALLDRPLVDPDTTSSERSGVPLQASCDVRVEDPQLCPVYWAEGFSGIQSKEAPLWLRRRLQAVGQRSLNGIVDVANYVMLEVGQPLHTFDLGRITSSGEPVLIEVRRACHGERLLCLDGVDRALDGETLVVAVAGRAAAVAGVIGGMESAVGAETNEVLVEVANFAWTSIRGTSRRLGLRSEASARFERPLSAHLVPIAAARFGRLLTQVLGGHARPDPIQAGRLPAPEAPIRIAASQVAGLLGVDITTAQATDALRRLQFNVDPIGGDLEVTPPSVRTDVRVAVDVVEEVGRIIGYQRIPGTLPAIRQPPSVTASVATAGRLGAEIAIGAGFHECITQSLNASDRDYPVLGVGEGRRRIALRNPLSSQLGALRLSLLPGLLAACQLNQGRGRERVQLFEQGRVFWPHADGRPEEPELFSLVDLAPDEDPDASAQRLFHLLRVCQALGDRVSRYETDFRPANRTGLHPGRCAEVWSAGQSRGVVGELDHRAVRDLQIRGRVVVAELRTDGWLVAGGRPSLATGLAKTPALTIDLAVTVPERAELGHALAGIRALQLVELEDVHLLDHYQGGQLPPGRKGWTFRLVFRDPERTLTKREAELLRERVMAWLGGQQGAAPR